MTARDTIAAVLRDSTNTTYAEDATAVLTAIRGMSHDELRQLRPDIAILFDATQDTANTRGDYIINLIVQRIRAVERLHTQSANGAWCRHCGYHWPCHTTRALRGQS